MLNVEQAVEHAVKKAINQIVVNEAQAAEQASQEVAKGRRRI